jgi:hypothetical protein
MAPPTPAAVFPLKVEFVTVILPLDKMAPSLYVLVFSIKYESVTVTAPRE